MATFGFVNRLACGVTSVPSQNRVSVPFRGGNRSKKEERKMRWRKARNRSRRRPGTGVQVFQKKNCSAPRTTLHILLSSTFARAILRRLHFVDNDTLRSSSSVYPSSVTWRYYPTKILHLQSQMCLPRNGDHPSKGSSIFIPHHLAQLHHVIINIFKLQRKTLLLYYGITN